MNRPGYRRLWLVWVAVVVAGGAWQARRMLNAWTAEQLGQRHQQTLALLADRDAAAFIRRLARDDDQWLSIIIAALADSRSEVAAAATIALHQRAEQWRELPPDEAAPRIAELAHALAPLAAELPAQRQRWAGNLARQLLAWPSAGRQVDAAQFIADCETILRFVPADSDEARVAQAERNPAILPQTAAPTQSAAAPGRNERPDTVPNPPPPMVAPQAPSLVAPKASPSAQPFANSPDAGSGRFVEPRPFGVPYATPVKVSR